MRIGLAPIEVTPNQIERNLQRIEKTLKIFRSVDVDIALFPEYCVTGFTEWDFSVAKYYPYIVKKLSKLANKYGINIIAGIIEEGENCIYNSAVLIDKQGKILLKHRKLQEPKRFCRGKEVKAVNTVWGNIAILICGDLYNEEAEKKLIEARPDYLFIPMDYSPEKLNLREEIQVMGKRIGKLKVKTFITNTYKHHGSFGGSWVYDKNGKLIAMTLKNAPLIIQEG